MTCPLPGDGARFQPGPQLESPRGQPRPVETLVIALGLRWSLMIASVACVASGLRRYRVRNATARLRLLLELPHSVGPLIGPCSLLNLIAVWGSKDACCVVGVLQHSHAMHSGYVRLKLGQSQLSAGVCARCPSGRFICVLSWLVSLAS